MTTPPADDRSLPLRERKRLRTRRALADTALRMFTEQGFEATTLDALVEEVEVSKSTFFRAFPAKEAVAIEAETEVWSRYLDALRGRTLSGPVLSDLHACLAGALSALDAGWDDRYVRTRRLILTAPALLAHADYHRTTVQDEAVGILAGKLGLDPEDLRIHVLVQLASTCWTVAARDWTRRGGQGGRDALARRLAGAFGSVPESLRLSAAG